MSLKEFGFLSRFSEIYLTFRLVLLLKLERYYCMFLEHCIRLIESKCLLLSIEKLLVFVQIMFVLLKYLRKALKCSASVQIKLSLLI